MSVTYYHEIQMLRNYEFTLSYAPGDGNFDYKMLKKFGTFHTYQFGLYEERS